MPVTIGGIHYDTYNKRCNSVKFHNQLESMCLGLEDKGNDVIWRPVDSHNAIAVYNEVAKMMNDAPTSYSIGEGMGETFIKGVKSK